MPWSETCAMDERMRFVVAASEDDAVMSELCAEFGISRQTGYKVLARYREEGVEGLKERSRAPLSHGRAREEAVVEAVLALRERHPTWGPKKLRKKLGERLPGVEPPARSTIGDWLRKEGLTSPRRPRRRCPPFTSPFLAADGPNAVWCADFKGWFLTGDRRRCDPLTISDAMSRYLLRCQALDRPDGAHARPVFEAAFCEFGLPLAIRSDNGPPFASIGAGGLSRLSVWWIKLGVKPERIEPGKPQQNGRHERMHRTLKAETADPPAASLAEQQRRFDAFRVIYNDERPHEALDFETPSALYRASPARLPLRLARAGLSAGRCGASRPLERRDQMGRRPRLRQRSADRRTGRDRGDRGGRMAGSLRRRRARLHRQDRPPPPSQAAAPAGLWICGQRRGVAHKHTAQQQQQDPTM